jgi:hypothetical protein
MLFNSMDSKGTSDRSYQWNSVLERVAPCSESDQTLSWPVCPPTQLLGFSYYATTYLK